MNARLQRMSPPTHPNRSRRTLSAARNPSIDEIRARRESAVWLDASGNERRGLSQAQSARIVTSNVRSWENWETDPAMENHRKMPPAVWELFNIKLTVLELLAKEKITPAEIKRLGVQLPKIDD